MPRKRSQWMYVVDPEYAEQVCSMSWRSAAGGYLRGKSSRNEKPIYMHAIVWQLAHGSSPPPGLEIDHINRIKWDNRLSNLRLTTKSGNQFNRRHPNRTGLPHGVCLRRDVPSRPYAAAIRIRGTKKHLGYYETPEEASAVYEKARSEVIAKEEAKACQSTVRR